MTSWIRWTTNEIADSRVEFGIQPPFPPYEEYWYASPEVGEHLIVQRTTGKVFQCQADAFELVADGRYLRGRGCETGWQYHGLLVAGGVAARGHLPPEDRIAQGFDEFAQIDAHRSSGSSRCDRFYGLDGFNQAWVSIA